MNNELLRKIQMLMNKLDDLAEQRLQIDREYALAEQQLEDFEVVQKRASADALLAAPAEDIAALAEAVAAADLPELANAVSLPSNDKPVSLPKGSDAETAALALYYLGKVADVDDLVAVNLFGDALAAEAARTKLVNAMQHLKKLGIVVSPRRGRYDFTGAGRTAVANRANEMEADTPKT